jgi:hypothetical protein
VQERVAEAVFEGHEAELLVELEPAALALE